MNALLNPRDGAILTIIDVTAHSISLFQGNEQPKSINELSIPQASVSIAEPIDVQVDGLGNNIIRMYQLIDVIINDGKVPGLERILDYMNDSFF